MAKKAALFALFLAPSLALAAGFAPQSIFLSKSPVTDGDTVKIYTIVSNEGADKFSGQVNITENGKDIGASVVTLAAGATQTTSIAWKPVAGTHTLSATMKSDAGTVVETKSATFVVNEKPKPANVSTPAPAPTQTATAVESSAGIQQSIDSVAPPVAGIVAPVFNTLDSVRQSIADVADKQIANVKPKIASQGQVEGASTENLPNNSNWFFSIAYTIYFYILTLVRFLVGSAGVFYPVFAILFLFILWRLFKRFRRA